MNPYLEPDEIETLTGRKYPGPQCRVLAERGWKFFPDADGRPQVLRAYHDQMMGLTPKQPPRRGPRLAGLARA